MANSDSTTVLEPKSGKNLPSLLEEKVSYKNKREKNLCKPNNYGGPMERDIIGSEQLWRTEGKRERIRR